jgi:enoyl-CoA hydratase
MFDNLLVERDGAVAILTINRPTVLNALNTQTVDELRRAMLELKADATARAIIVTGAGPKSFVAGADINELAVLSPTAGREHALVGQHVFDVIENLGKPVIAAINGLRAGRRMRTGDGVHAADRRRHARLGQPEIALGLIPGIRGHAAPATTRRQGTRDGDAAHRRASRSRRGAADRPRASRGAGRGSDDRGPQACGQLAANAPVAMRYIINAVNKGRRDAVRRSVSVRGDALWSRRLHRRHARGTAAFLEKRKPVFKGG